MKTFFHEFEPVIVPIFDGMYIYCSTENCSFYNIYFFIIVTKLFAYVYICRNVQRSNG